MNKPAGNVNTKHGVLYREDGHLMVMAGYVKEAHNVSSLADLLALAISSGLTHLWVHPSANILFPSGEAKELVDANQWDVGEKGKFISVQKQGKYKGYIASATGRLVFPRQTPNASVIFITSSNWPIDMADPDEVLLLAETIEKALGVRMAGSPTSVGLRYLEKLNTRYYEAYFQKSDKVDWLALKGSHVPSFAWFPTVNVPAGQQLYLHCFDRNGSQPFAAAQEDMGIGEPFHRVGGVFDAKFPGLWDVEIIKGNEQWPDLPKLIPGGRVWLPTPLIRVATMKDIGYQVKVNQAFLWPKGVRIFERWARQLYGFRSQYPTPSIESRAYKAVMNSTIGSTRIGEDMSNTLRPDWYATVLGAERAVVWYKLWKISQQYGVKPCGVYADALYYLSADSNPDTAVPNILAHKDSLGGYKHVFTLAVDKQVRAVLSNDAGAALRIGALKHLVKGQH